MINHLKSTSTDVVEVLFVRSYLFLGRAIVKVVPFP